MTQSAPDAPPPRILPRARITAAARMLGLTPRALRYYEQIGLVASERDRSNRRVYDRRALDRLAVIKELRAADFSLEEIEPLLSLLDQGDKALARAVARGLHVRLQCLEARRDALVAILERYEATSRGAPARTREAEP